MFETCWDISVLIGMYHDGCQFFVLSTNIGKQVHRSVRLECCPIIHCLGGKAVWLGVQATQMLHFWKNPLDCHRRHHHPLRCCY